MKRQIKKRILEPEKRIILDIPHEIKDFNMSSTPKNNLFAQLKPNSDKNVEKKVLIRFNSALPYLIFRGSCSKSRKI